MTARMPPATPASDPYAHGRHAARAAALAEVHPPRDADTAEPGAVRHGQAAAFTTAPDESAATAQLDPRTLLRGLELTLWVHAGTRDPHATYVRMQRDKNVFRLEANGEGNAACWESHVPTPGNATTHASADALAGLQRVCATGSARPIHLRFDARAIEADADARIGRTNGRPVGPERLHVAFAAVLDDPRPAAAAVVDPKALAHALGEHAGHDTRHRAEKKTTLRLTFTPGALTLGRAGDLATPTPVPCLNQPLTARHDVDATALQAFLAVAGAGPLRLLRRRSHGATALLARVETPMRHLALLARHPAVTAP